MANFLARRCGTVLGLVAAVVAGLVLFSPVQAQKFGGAPAGGGFKPPAAPKPPTPTPFPPDDLKAVCEDLIARYPQRAAALLPILHLAQRRFGGFGRGGRPYARRVAGPRLRPGSSDASVSCS